MTNKNEVKVFTFGESNQPVRVEVINNEPWFVAKDVCKILELKDVFRAISPLDDDEKLLRKIFVPAQGRTREMSVINESGLYTLIIRSSKPEAKQFRKWVTSEILPTIRKTGGYIPVQQEDSEEDIMARALLIAQKRGEMLKQQIQMLEGERDILKKENSIMAPKAQYTDDVLQSTSTITFTEMAMELKFRSAVALIRRLIDDRILYRQSGRPQPYAEYREKGYFTTRTHLFFRSNGEPDSSELTVITQAGREFLHRHFGIAFNNMPVKVNTVIVESGMNLMQ